MERVNGRDGRADLIPLYNRPQAEYVWSSIYSAIFSIFQLKYPQCQTETEGEPYYKKVVLL